MEDRIADLHPLVFERVRGVDLRGVVVEDRERRRGVPVFTMLWLPVTITSGIPPREAGERVEHGGIGPGLGLDRIEEVARMHEHVGLFPDDDVNRSKEIIVDLLLAQVHPRVRVEPGKWARPRCVSAMWTSFIVSDFYLGGGGI